MLSYEGIFFDEETTKLLQSLEPEHLEKTSDELHCTFKYRPVQDKIFDEIVGKEVELLVIGYGNDGKNSGFQVQLPEWIMEYYINYDEDIPEKLKVPHITISLAKDAIAAKTKDLSFRPLIKPFKIKGKFGYWIKEKGNGYTSYEPYKKKVLQ